MDIKILDEIKNMVEKGTLDEYVEAITNFKNELTSNGTAEIDETRIEAALLRKLCEDETALKSATTNSGSAAQESNSNTQRFFINVGSLDGFDKDSLKNFIIEHCEGVVNDEFTDSFVKDKFSFFELPKTRIDLVMKNLIGLKVNDREVNVELSEKKPHSSRGGFGGGRGGFGGGRGGYSHGRSNCGGYGRDSRDGGSRGYNRGYSNRDR